jgi:two-component system nitrate/nitrite response regulator NarL
MDNPVRIVLLDDHTLFREGLARLLDSEPGLSVIGQCDRIDNALAIIAREPVDLILLDYDLGDEVGTNILASLAVLKAAPRTLIVTAGMTPKSMREAVAAGAVGVVLKHSGPQSLMSAIWNAVRGDGVGKRRMTLPNSLPGSVQRKLTSIRDRPLTLRQSKALHAILDGLGNREIASELNMSESSVKAVIQELFDKSGVRTRSQLVRVAIEKHSTDWIGKNP